MTAQDAIDRILDPKQKVLCQNEFGVFGIIGDDERAIFKAAIENRIFDFYLLTEQDCAAGTLFDLSMKIGAACYNAQRRDDEPPADEIDPDRVRNIGSMVLEGWKGPIFSQDTVGATDNWSLYCFFRRPETEPKETANAEQEEQL